MVNQAFWQGKKVTITGHTGFKGAWLTLWLLNLGAKVQGLSLEPNTEPSLFNQLGLASELEHQIQDIRDREQVAKLITQFQPDLIFHLAAQPLVRLSYREPVETWETNVLGTINILESVKNYDQACGVICITTDKCYHNQEWFYGYRENDPLGGHDPYSSSKGAAEIAIASWRKSFFNDYQNMPVGVASARAGNVIGGGDWALDRIVPDAMRALINQQPIPVRNPRATRPWQHVLEPLGGYLCLAENIYQNLHAKNFEPLNQLCSPFNFGPNLNSNQSVKTLVETILNYWPGQWLDQSDPQAVHEANLLNLVIDKAFHLLQWQPKWNFAKTIEETVCWYRESQGLETSGSFQDLTLKQIKSYHQCSTLN